MTTETRTKYETVEKTVEVEICDWCGCEADVTEVLTDDLCAECIEDHFGLAGDEIASITKGEGSYGEHEYIDPTVEVNEVTRPTIEWPELGLTEFSSPIDDDGSMLINILLHTLFYPILVVPILFMSNENENMVDWLSGLRVGIISTAVWLGIPLLFLLL